MNNAAFTEAADGTIVINQQQPFTHIHHLQLAFYLLQQHDFFKAIHLFVEAVKVLVEAFGAQDKFHCTITLGFLSLVAERMEAQRHDNFQSFLISNRDLLDKGLLHQWYPATQLNSTAAQKAFVLPSLVQGPKISVS